MHPQKTAIILPDGEISYQQLRDDVINLALNLRDRGFKSGHVIGMEQLDNTVEEITSILALTLLGCTWIKRISHWGSNITLNYIIANKKFYDPTLQNVIYLSDSLFKRPIQCKHINHIKGFGFNGYENATQPWYLAQSSGTTGKPKLMPITSQMLFARIQRYKEYNIPDVKIMLLFHVFAPVALLHVMLSIYKAGTFIADPKYLHSDYIMGSPSHFNDFLNELHPPKEPFMKEARVVGSVVNAKILENLLRYFKTVRIGYGSTETGSTAMKLFDKVSDEISVGHSYDNVTIEIVDENHMPLQNGLEGAVRIKSNAQVKAYLFADKEQNACFLDDWFYPGDKGYFSSSLELYITGRVKDDLNINGIKIDALEIDDFLSNFDSILKGICFFEMDEKEEMKILSCLLVLDSSCDKTKTLKSLITNYKQNFPRIHHLLKYAYITEELPTNENGKIMRHKAGEITESLEKIDLQTF
jgi:acyl-coenzyme A synthetase/AMP-(fatty) acid ligase